MADVSASNANGSATRRIDVAAPMPSDGVGAALRSAFAGGKALPGDFERLLAKLGRVN